MRLAARLAALALLAGCAIAPAAGASSSSHGDRDGKAGTGFSVDRSAASSLNLTSLLVAPAAAASSSPQIQYLGDTAGTSFAFSLRNTGVTSIGALQVARPTASWTITDCPAAPAGWSVTRSDKTCRYRSAAGTADDLPIGQTWTTFEATATTLGSTLNGKGAWKLLVSSTESFSDPLNLASASSEAPGLGVFTYSFQVLDAGVVASAPAAGDPCPSLTKNATAGSAKTLVICGRNRTSAAATPVVPPTALAGSFLQGAGSFSSGSIAPSGPASASVVLGIWTGAEVDSSTGSGMDLIVDIGSASTTTSPQTTLGGFTVGPANAAPTDIQLSNTSVAENQPSGTNVGSFSTTDPDAGDTHTYSLVSGTGDADNGSFQISGNTLQTNAVFDFETKSSYSIRIRTTDSGNASFEKQFTITVTDVAGDVPPTAVDDSATVGEDSGASAIDVLVNDTDPDGGPKTISSASDPANGTVVLTGGPPATGLTYQPDPNYCNNPPGTTPDTFTYTLNGGSTATVSVTVTCVDDPPTAVDDSATVAEDSGASAIDVLVNDTNPDGGPKTISSASDPANGTVVLTGGPPATGLTYQPDPNYCNNPPGTT